MAAPTYNVFVGDGASIGPSRPSAADFGGTEKQNAVTPPNPRTMPDARDANQKAWALDALCRVIGSCTVSVAYTANVPHIVDFWSLREDIIDVGMYVTEIAAGVVDIIWNVGSFPAGPRPSGLTNNNGANPTDQLSAEQTAVNTVRVMTYYNGSGVRTPFTITIGGETV